jgi:hypothetical protein
VRASWKADGIRSIYARGLCSACYRHQRINGELAPQPIRTIPAAPKGDHWALDGLCAQSDPWLWYPGKGQGDAIAKAKHICSTCPVCTECLGAALEGNETHGIWGGMTPGERRALKRGSAA